MRKKAKMYTNGDNGFGKMREKYQWGSWVCTVLGENTATNTH